MMIRDYLDVPLRYRFALDSTPVKRRTFEYERIEIGRYILVYRLKVKMECEVVVSGHGVSIQGSWPMMSTEELFPILERARMQYLTACDTITGMGVEWLTEEEVNDQLSHRRAR